MKAVLLIVLAIASALPMAAQDSQADLGVMAIGMVVSDIEKSEKFYSEVLGLVPAGNFSLDSRWSDEAGAANGKPFSVKMYKLVQGRSATVLKLAYFDAVEKRPAATGVDSYAGVNYLTLNYSDLSEVLERVSKAGIELLGWVKRENYQLVFIRDPDGVFIELVGPPEQ